MYQSGSAAVKQDEADVENAARTLGKSRWQVFMTVSCRLAWPGVLAGIVRTFASGLGEFGATLMLAGYIPNVTDTIPIAIYFAVEAGDMSTAKIWVVTILALGFFAILWLNWWSARNMMRHTR